MINPLTLKLGIFADLPDEDRRTIEGLCSDVRIVSARSDLIKEGERPEVVFLLLEGWACRYKILPDGNRQIIAYLLPGDLCDVHIYILKEMDHSIGLLSDANVAAISKQKITDIFERGGLLARALWWSTLVDEGVLREWVVTSDRGRFALVRPRSGYLCRDMDYPLGIHYMAVRADERIARFGGRSMILSDMAPAIVAVVFAGAGYLYALRIRSRLHAARRAHRTPAE